MNHRPIDPRPRQAASRRGTTLLLLPLLIVAGLSGLIVAVDFGTLHLVGARMRVATDAAALAAALALVDDRSLIDSGEARAALLGEARAEAARYGAANRLGAAGTPAVEVEFLDEAADRGGPEPVAGFGPSVVRAAGRRDGGWGGVPLILPQVLGLRPFDLEIRSAARVDRQVVGFRPVAGRPVPMVPIGLLSDPTGVNPRSWEHQLVVKPRDAAAFDRAALSFAMDGGDGLPEARFDLGAAALPLVLTTADQLGRQVAEGLGPLDLDGRGGQFVLVGPGATAPTLPEAALLRNRDRLAAALEAIRSDGLPRAWPLVQQPRQPGGPARVTGFVAARVVHLDRRAGLRLWVQPAALATSTAVTAPQVGSGANVARADIPDNPFIAKVRLIQ